MEFSGEHLSYEMEMFFASAAEQMFMSEQYNGSVKNALLESFVIHARSLLFFFYAENILPDDAAAQHFMKSPFNWSEVRPTMTPTLQLLQRRVGKEVAHLTYHRAKILPDQKVWNFSPIIFDFVSVFQAFVKYSDPKKLHPHLLEVGNRWVNVLIEREIFSVVPTDVGVQK